MQETIQHLLKRVESVSQWEMQRIFENGNKPFCIFNFFATIVGTINNITKEWHMSQDGMVEIFGGSKRTVNDYLQQLEEMKLLKKYHHDFLHNCFPH